VSGWGHRWFKRSTGRKACDKRQQRLWWLDNNNNNNNNICRSQWPRGLRRRSRAVRLLRYCVRIPPGNGCLSVVCVVCCQVEVSVTSWSLVQRSPTDCGASLCSIKKAPERGGHSLRWAESYR
jgi:hypothetical protein